MTTPAPGAIDCDIHPALPSMQVLVALSGRVLARPRPDARPRPRQLHAPAPSRRTRRSTPAPTGSPPKATPAPTSPRCKRRRSTPSAPATPSATSCTARQAIFSEDLVGRLLPRHQRLGRQGVAGSGRPPARLHRRADAQPGARGARKIERVAADHRFVQVLVWEMQEIPLGRRIHWPIYRVAEQLDLPIGIHAGSSLPPSADQSRLAVVLPGRLRLLVHRFRRRAELV